MRIAILSDIHDHLKILTASLNVIHEEEIDAMIVCGDFCSPFVMNKLGNEFEGPIHAVFGNNDGDQFRLTKTAAKWPDRVHLYGEFGEFKIEGAKFALTHYPEIAEQVAAAGNFDVVCYGHDHQRKLSRFNTRGHEVVLINPGTLMGHRFDQGNPVETPSSFAILDLEEDKEVTFWRIVFEDGRGWVAAEEEE